MKEATAQDKLVRYLAFDVRPWTTFAKALLAEYFCTALFLFLATGTVSAGCHTKDTAERTGAGSDTTLTNVRPGSCFLGSSNLLNIAMAFGFSIFVLVYAAASFSGGHLNPAVTLGFVLAYKVSVLRGIAYIICQCLGACTGSALVKAIDTSGFRAALGAVNQLNDGVAERAAWGLETILTMVLVFMVFAATDAERATKTAHLPVLAPLAIGMTVFLCHLVAVPLDGCGINPARSFGTAAVAHQWTDQWVFWVGPFSGAVLATVGYEIFFRTHDWKLVVAPEASDATAQLPEYPGEQGFQEVKQNEVAGREGKAGTPADGDAVLPGYTGAAGMKESPALGDIEQGKGGGRGGRPQKEI